MLWGSNNVHKSTSKLIKDHNNVNYYSECTWEPFENIKVAKSCFFFNLILHLTQSPKRYAPPSYLQYLTIHLFNKHSLTVPRVPGTVLDAGDRTINETPFLPSGNINLENSNTTLVPLPFYILNL